MNAPERINAAPEAVGELDRRTYIGGARVAAILGLDPYGKTPLTEYQAIVGELENKPDAERLAFFEWRKEWEPIVIKRVIREFDANIVSVNQRYRDAQHDFLAAEIDGEWIDENGETQNLEIKTVHPIAFSERSGWGQAGTGDVPVNYAAQCMHGLGVTGRKTCILVAMAGIDTFVFYRIDRDDEVIEDMRARCVAFWNNHVIPRIPPEPISLDDCMRLAMKMRGKPVEADVDMVENLRSLNGIRESIRAMEGEKDEVMFKIASAVLKQWGIDCADSSEVLAASKDDAVIVRGAEQLATWNLQLTTRIDSKALRDAAPATFAQYSKTTPSRVLRIKKPK